VCLNILAKRLCRSAPMGGATPGFCIEIARWANTGGRCRKALIVATGKLKAMGPIDVAAANGIWAGGSLNFPLARPGKTSAPRRRLSRPIESIGEMRMSQRAQMVVDQFRKMVEPDGGELEMLGIEGGTVRVRYMPGHNEECETCVFIPEDLRDLMKEAMQRQDPSILEVVMETVESPV
jgi:Fe-S cluster biogenesis protein NfuA